MAAQAHLQELLITDVAIAAIAVADDVLQAHRRRCPINRELRYCNLQLPLVLKHSNKFSL